MNAAHDQRADAAEQRRVNCAGTISDGGLQRRRSLPLFECRVSHLVLLIALEVLLVETPVKLGPDRFFSGTTGVMRGMGTNWTCAERCTWRT